MVTAVEQAAVLETPAPLSVTIRPPVPVVVEEVRTSVTAQAIIETAHELTVGSKMVIDSIKNAAIATGRWLGRHRVGVSYAASGALGLFAACHVAKGIYDADFYNTMSDSVNIALGVDVPERPKRDVSTDNISAGGISGFLSMTAGVFGLMLRDDKRDRGEL